MTLSSFHVPKRQEVHSSTFFGGLYQPLAASFYPAKVVYAIAREVKQMGGVRIFTNTLVHEVIEQDGGPSKSYIVKTDRGEVTTSCVVYATNAWCGRTFAQLVLQQEAH